MHCSRCRSPMIQTRSITSSESRQHWYECPDCHRVSVSTATDPRSALRQVLETAGLPEARLSSRPAPA